MNSDLIPALAAAGGGSVLIGGIWLHESRRAEAMRRSRVRLGLRFPASLDPLAAKASIIGLAGLPEANELLFEVAADGDGIKHFLWVPATVRASVVSVLTGAMPGLRVAETPAPKGRATLALRVFIPTPTALSIENPEAASRTLLSGLGALAVGSEQVVIRWAVRPSQPPQLRTAEPLDHKTRAIQQAWRQKTHASGGFQVSALVLVRAARVSRARELVEHVASAIRSRRGSVGGPRTTSERGNRSLVSLPRITRSSGWLNTAELLPLLGWPLGDDVAPGVETAPTRQIPPRKELAREGRPLFVAEHQGSSRPVALSRQAALRHAAVLGASGGGKSTILAAGILWHVAAGDGGVVFDPGGDLVSTVIDHADTGAERITLLDPTAPVVPGVDLFAGGDPDLRAETLVAMFRSLFKDAWGPRIDSYLRLGLRTLAEVPGSSLLDLPQLFLDSQARRRAVGMLRDPLLVGQWEVLGQLSEAERMQHLQAPLSRIFSLITRPPVRAVFGPEPSLDVAELLRNRGWLLVPLSSGVIGTASARIIASALTYVVWSAVSARAAIPPERRRPIFLFFDELQALTDQRVGLEDLLEQSRKYGASLTIATQAIGRTPEAIRHSLLSNVGTLISLRSGADESARIARELPGLTARDIQMLPPFEVAARVAAGPGSGSIVVTGRTEPLGKPTGRGELIRELSAKREGRSRDEVEAAIRQRYGTKLEPTLPPHSTDEPSDDDETLGRTRRQR
jgi:Type IV secretion-system coupling protein DNA-binding domain